MINILEDNIPYTPGPSKETWISALTHLPSIGGSYLCIVEYPDELFGIQRERHVCYFNENTQKFYWSRMEAKITHWIPMPEIPELKK